MDAAEQGTGGWLELAARLCRVLVTSPRLRDNLELVLRHLDPEEAPALARALLRSDPGLTLAMVGALPRLANAGVEFLREAAGELLDLPPRLLQEVAGELWADLRLEALGEALALLLLPWLQARHAATGADGAAPDRGDAAPRRPSRLAGGAASALWQRAGIGLGEAGLALGLALLRGVCGALELELSQRPELAGRGEQAAMELQRILAQHPRVTAELVAPLAQAAARALEEAQTAAEEPSDDA